MAEFFKQLTDVGTRYTHYRDLMSDLEDGVEVFRRKLENVKYQRPEDAKSYIKLSLALEVVSQIVDLDANVLDKDEKYKFERAIEEVHLDRHILASLTPFVLTEEAAKKAEENKEKSENSDSK